MGGSVEPPVEQRPDDIGHRIRPWGNTPRLSCSEEGIGGAQDLVSGCQIARNLLSRFGKLDAEPVEQLALVNSIAPIAPSGVGKQCEENAHDNRKALRATTKPLGSVV